MDRYCLHFNGNVGCSVTVPYSDVFCMGSGDFTISFWANRDIDGQATVIDYFDFPFPAPGVNRGYYADLVGGVDARKFRIHVSDNLGNDETILTSFTNDLNKWYYIAFVYDKTGTGFCTPYVNGYAVEVDGALGPKDISGIGNLDFVNPSARELLSIGNRYAGNDAFMGYLDDIRIYKGVALTASQIYDIYNYYEPAGQALGKKVDESLFENITSNGWYSNIDDGEGEIVTSKKIKNGTWGSKNAYIEQNGHVVWATGGVPFQTFMMDFYRTIAENCVNSLTSFGIARNYIQNSVDEIVDITRIIPSAAGIELALMKPVNEASLYMSLLYNTSKLSLSSLARILNNYIIENYDNNLTAFVNQVNWEEGCVPELWVKMSSKSNTDNWNICSIS